MTEVAVKPADLGIPESFAMPARKDWRIGMVGFGGIARSSHAPAYQQAGWTIAAVADPKPEARTLAAERFGVAKVVADHMELIDDDSIEVIDLLTHPTIREEVVLAALKAGKHVITEKPFAQTMAECERMVEAAERCGRKLAVHQNYRWNPGNFAARHLIQTGWIGKPFFASIEIFGSQDVGLAKHDFYAKCDDFLTIQWNNHLVDLLRCWVGMDAHRVLTRTRRMEGQNFVSDNLLISLHEFSDGVTGNIVHSELLRSSLRRQECRVDGDEGSLVFDFQKTLALESRRLEGGPRRIDFAQGGWVSSFAGSMGDFLAAIEQDREPAVSGRANLATIRTILAEQVSARAGGVWVTCV